MATGFPPDQPRPQGDVKNSGRASVKSPLGPPIAELLGGRDNNFNLIRMIAAMAVLVSHAAILTTGDPASEPLLQTTGQSLGHFAVGIFFGISGLLIARSFDRRKSFWHFVASRVLRLWPALLVVLLLTALLLGPAMTSMDSSAYFASRETWIYVPSNLSLAMRSDHLPGLFADNPLSDAVNGSLWSLFYEVVCYGGVVAVGAIGLLRSRKLFLVFLLLVTAAHIAAVLAEPQGGLAYILGVLGLVGFPFALGTAIYVWRGYVRMGPAGAAVLWLGAIALSTTPFLASGILVALVYTTLWLALVPKGPLLGYNRLGDYSYGTYIYAFPVQQTLIALHPGMTPLTNVLLAMPLTLALAIASWTLVEDRALRAARPVGDWLFGLVTRSANRVS